MRISSDTSTLNITLKALKKRFKRAVKTIATDMNDIHLKLDLHENRKENSLISTVNSDNLAPFSFNTQPFDFAFSGFKGITIEEKKHLFGTSSKKQIIASHHFHLEKIQANHDHIDMLIWFQMMQAIMLYKNNGDHPIGTFIPADKAPDSIFKSAVSAALIISTQSDAEALGVYHLILHYAEQALTPMPFEAEAFSMLPLIIEDLRGCLATLHKEHKISIDILMDLASQMASSCNGELTTSWLNFIRKSQTLAWLGYAPEQILSAAVHGSDDAAIRNIASSLSETLGMTPLREFPIHKHYNPFMIEKANERSHEMLISDICKTLLSEAVQEKSAALLFTQAQKQCAALLNGHVIGWCAGFLLELHDFFERSFEIYMSTNSEEIFMQDALAKAEKETAHVSWAALEDYSMRVIEMHRRGVIPDKDEELLHLEQYPDTAPIAYIMQRVQTEK